MPDSVVEEEITRLEAHLASLRTGRIQIGERSQNGEWPGTKTQIFAVERAISDQKMVLERRNAQTQKAPKPEPGR